MLEPAVDPETSGVETDTPDDSVTRQLIEAQADKLEEKGATGCLALTGILWFIICQLKESKGFLLVFLVVVVPDIDPANPSTIGTVNTVLKVTFIVMVILLFIVDSILHLVFMKSNVKDPFRMAIFYGAYKESLKRRIYFAVALAIVLLVAIGILATTVIGVAIYIFGTQTAQVYDYCYDDTCPMSCWCKKQTLTLSASEKFFFFMHLVTSILACLVVLGRFFAVLRYNGASCISYVRRIRILCELEKANRFPRLNFSLLSALSADPDIVLDDLISTIPLVDTAEEIPLAQECATTSHLRWDWITSFSTEDIVFCHHLFYDRSFREKDRAEDVKEYHPLFTKKWCLACCSPDKYDSEFSADALRAKTEMTQEEGEEEAAVSEEIDPDSDHLESHGIPPTSPIYKLPPKTGISCESFKAILYFIVSQLNEGKENLFLAFVVSLPTNFASKSTNDVMKPLNYALKGIFIAIVAAMFVVDSIGKLVYMKKQVKSPFRMAVFLTGYREAFPRRLLFIVASVLLFAFNVVVFFTIIIQIIAEGFLTCDFLDSDPGGKDALWDKTWAEKAAIEMPATCECMEWCVSGGIADTSFVLGTILTSVVACLIIFGNIRALMSYDGPSCVTYVRELRAYERAGLLDRFPTFNISFLAVLVTPPERIVEDVMMAMKIVERSSDIPLAQVSMTTSHHRWDWVAGLTTPQIHFLRWFLLRKRYDLKESTKDHCMYGRLMTGRHCKACCFLMCNKCKEPEAEETVNGNEDSTDFVIPTAGAPASSEGVVGGVLEAEVIEVEVEGVGVSDAVDVSEVELMESGDAVSDGELNVDEGSN